MLPNLFSTERRAASVGCAVKTGRTDIALTQLSISSLLNSCPGVWASNASSMRSTARASQEPPVARASAKTRAR